MEYQTDKRLPVGDLLANIDNIAANLLSHGFQKSVPVAFVMANGIDYVQLVLAVLKLGGIVSLINALSSAGM